MSVFLQKELSDRGMLSKYHKSMFFISYFFSSNLTSANLRHVVNAALRVYRRAIACAALL